MIPLIKIPDYWRTLRIDLRVEPAIGARVIGSIRDGVDEIIIIDSTGCEKNVKPGEYLVIDKDHKFIEAESY